MDNKENNIKDQTLKVKVLRIFVAKSQTKRKKTSLAFFKKHCLCDLQKQPSRGVLKKRCSENMQQICRRTPMPKCNFNKVA